MLVPSEQILEWFAEGRVAKSGSLSLWQYQRLLNGLLFIKNRPVIAVRCVAFFLADYLAVIKSHSGFEQVN